MKLLKHHILSLIVILTLWLSTGMGDRFMLGIFVTYFFYAIITIIQILLDKQNNQKSREILIFGLMLVIAGMLTYVHLAMNVGATSLIR